MGADEHLPSGRKLRWLWFIHWGTMVALFCAYLATVVSPATFSWLAFAGLAYPLIFLVHVLLTTLWLVLRYRVRSIVAVVVLLVGWGVHDDFFGISNGEASAKWDVKVMTYNVRVFDLYNWSDGSRMRDSIFNLLDAEQPDIICFQEFYHTNKKGVFETRDTLIQFLPTKYYHEKYTHKMVGEQFFGVATFSKYPILERGSIPFVNDENNFCIWIDVSINGNRVRVYNAHLASIRFDYDDYGFIKDENKRNWEGAARIGKRMGLAFEKRAAQVAAILEHMDQSPYPVIFGCDMNDSPVSFSYHCLEQSLTDAFIESGTGIGQTYAGDFPSFRIDYLFTSPTIQPTEVKVIRKKFSDHYPLVAKFRVGDGGH
ncbi:MAG: endonuclease/exonuclease/phosphatase family protein [Flavobacteriales bacterium]|nr:endonuclease/exonuclease/phosphatase family protein [Flavobacteriales bacterium]